MKLCIYVVKSVLALSIVILTGGGDDGHNSQNGSILYRQHTKHVHVLCLSILRYIITTSIVFQMYIQYYKKVTS